MQSTKGSTLQFFFLVLFIHGDVNGGFHPRSLDRQFLEALSLSIAGTSQTITILPPALLLRELHNIRQHITGQELDLPFHVSTDTIHYFYKIASTRSRIMDNQLIVSMSIPLVGLQHFDLIKSTSFPRLLSNGLYSFIIPDHEYIAIDIYRERYLTLSHQELENCYDLRHDILKPELICMQSSPILQVTSSRDDCSITLLTQQQEINNCNIRVSNITAEIWLKLRQDNSWIYTFPQQQVLYIRCNNLPTVEKVMNGTGIIKMKEDCQIKTNAVLLEAHTIFNSEIFPQIKPPLSTYHHRTLS